MLPIDPSTLVFSEDPEKRAHKGITIEYWSKFSTMVQLANVGADVGRCINWKNKGDLEIAAGRFRAAIEQLDLTMLDPKTENNRLRELKIVREALVDYFIGPNEYKSTDEAWEDYFHNFGLMAARERGF